MQETRLVLDWYDRNARTLPWRVRDGLGDPYHVWLSEVMLQQTTVQAVTPYFRAFITRWPCIHDLAAAPLEDVLAAWAGLGYYARARHLHDCAKTISLWRNGRFPEDESALRQLPGIGDYTAAAIAAIAFGRPATPVDGNIERVMSRLYAITTPLPQARPQIRERAKLLTPTDRPGDFAQALMDLGATICTPKKPACALCPLRPHCAALAQGLAESLPAKAPKPDKPTRYGIALWLTDERGQVALKRRPTSGLLGGMLEIPGSDWTAERPVLDHIQPTPCRLLPGLVRHTFSHFHLELQVAAGRAKPHLVPGAIWCPLDRLGEMGLPTVMMKIVRHALAKGH